VASAFHRGNQDQPSAKVEQGIPLSNPAPTCGIDANLELIPQLESTPWNRFQVSKFFKNSPSGYKEGAIIFFTQGPILKCFFLWFLTTTIRPGNVLSFSDDCTKKSASIWVQRIFFVRIVNFFKWSPCLDIFWRFQGPHRPSLVWPDQWQEGNKLLMANQSSVFMLVAVIGRKPIFNVKCPLRSSANKESACKV